MIAVNRVKSKAKRHTRTSKQARETELMADKRNSPGVPPNTCPFIDLTKTIMEEMHQAYDRLYERGHLQPKMDELKQLADDQLEYIRRANETLRDNSEYWYAKYKRLMKK